MTLEAEGIGRKFGGKWIFRRLSFSVEPGQVLTILGNNGSGKSTLLKILAGILSPSEGKVYRPEGELRTQIGYSALDMNVYPPLTAHEHLELSAKLRGIEPRAQQLLERVGLLGVEGKFAGQFSTGMRARLKLALALQPNPKVLLLDEPTAALDHMGRALISDVVLEQISKGSAVILATNDQQDRRLATHELNLDE